LLIKGKLEKKAGEAGEECKLIADTAELLTDVRERRTRLVHLMLETEEVTTHMPALSTLFAESEGRCPVHLHVRMEDLAWVELKLADQIRVIPDDALLQGIEVLTRRPGAVKLV
jgi:hypothetical protein